MVLTRYPRAYSRAYSRAYCTNRVVVFPYSTAAAKERILMHGVQSQEEHC